MKHERKTKTLIIIHTAMLMGILLFSTSLKADLQRDMLSFEQRYIPLLLLTAQSDAQSVVASEKLIIQWNEFKQQHAYGHQDDSLWGFDLESIERQILNAQRLIQAGHFKLAYTQLVKVRTRFIAMRERHNIPFYIDELSRFDSPLQVLLAKFRLNQADDVYVEISQARTAWQSLMQTEINFNDYDLTLQQMEYLHHGLLKGERTLASMQEHFIAADYGKLEELAIQMQDLYSQTYAIFGAD
ncbi:MAG: hypothetical protein OEX12_04600 [Gammaproteobacteria bacterium]|nr:hypothetical protein [Gammaproteobacteria bacterium]